MTLVAKVVVYGLLYFVWKASMVSKSDSTPSTQPLASNTCSLFMIGFIIMEVVVLSLPQGKGGTTFCSVKEPGLLACMTKVTVEFPAETFAELDINGLHELRFMLFCFLIPALPAARIAAWLPETVI